MRFLNFYSDAFMTKENWLNILDNHMAHQLILGIGMTFVIATAGIDLSVGAILALSGIVLALALNNGYSISVSVVFALLAATGMDRPDKSHEYDEKAINPRSLLATLKFHLRL